MDFFVTLFSYYYYLYEDELYVHEIIKIFFLSFRIKKKYDDLCWVVIPAEIIQASYNDIMDIHFRVDAVLVWNDSHSLMAGRMFERGTILPCRYTLYM